jgi:hypothetical protein
MISKRHFHTIWRHLKADIRRRSLILLTVVGCLSLGALGGYLRSLPIFAANAQTITYLASAPGAGTILSTDTFWLCQVANGCDPTKSLVRGSMAQLGTYTTNAASAAIEAANGNYTGANTATNLNIAKPDTTACPSGVGTLTPIANVEQCVLVGNLTMAPPATFTPYQSIVEELTESSTGGFSVTPCSICEFPGGQLNSDGTVKISTSPNAENEIDCGTVLISSNKMHCTVAAGFSVYVPSTTISVTANGVNPTQCSGSGESNCAGPALTVTSGEILTVEDFVCAANCSGTPPGISSVTGSGTGTLGTCVEFSISGTKANPDFGIDAYLCPVTGSGTITPTVNYNATGYWGFVFAQAISGAVGDDGIGNAVTGSSTAPSVSTNGLTSKTTGNGDLCISEFGASDNGTQLTLGQTILNYAQTSMPNLGTQYQNAGTTPTAVTANASFTVGDPEIGLIVCLK